MTALISPELARQHLRLDDDPEGAESLTLPLYVAAAEQAARDYIDRQVFADESALAAALMDGSAGTGAIVANHAIRAAMLLILGHLYANREDVVAGVSVAELPMGSRALLAPYRQGMGG